MLGRAVPEDTYFCLFKGLVIRSQTLLLLPSKKAVTYGYPSRQQGEYQPNIGQHLMPYPVHLLLHLFLKTEISQPMLTTFEK